MNNFWSLIIDALAKLITWFVFGMFPTHQDSSIAPTVLSWMQTFLGSSFIIIFSMFNMTWPIILMGWELGLEIVRLALAGWRTVLKIIPGAG
jgi:hypothetical protein